MMFGTKSVIHAAAMSILGVVLATPAFAQSPTRTLLVISPNPVAASNSAEFTAFVDGLGRGAPIGTVTFSDNGKTLGTVSLSPMGAGQSVMAGGGDHTCTLTTSGGAKCWGENYAGQIGNGTYSDQAAPVWVHGLSSGVAALARGEQHSCALTVAGGVKCWGNNAAGSLGDGTTLNRLVPVSVSGLSSGVASVSGGAHHTCSVTNAGAVKCWGDNYFGQLGDGTLTSHLTPVVAGAGVLPLISAVVASNNYTCALNSNFGLVFCWGNNLFGRLGDGTYTHRKSPVLVNGLSDVAAIDAGTVHACALTKTGGVKCWGNNGFGQLGDGTNTDRTTPVTVSGLTSGVVAISVGSGHTCALTSAGSVKCWGLNSNGQVGDGTTSNRLTPVQVSGLTSGVVAIAAGGNHSCAMTASGHMKCWGYNASGQLGDGSKTSRLTPVSTMGISGMARSRAKFTASGLSVGSHPIKGHYTPSGHHLGSSAIVSLKVQ